MSTVLLKIELLIAYGVRRGGLDGVASVDFDGGCVLRKTEEWQVGTDHRRRILQEKEKRTFVVPSETILDAPLKKSLMPILILMEGKVLEEPLLPSTPILPLSSPNHGVIPPCKWRSRTSVVVLYSTCDGKGEIYTFSAEQ